MLRALIRDHGFRDGLASWWWDLRRMAPARWKTNAWRGLANRLPRRLVYFATIRAYAAAWPEDREPTFQEVVDPWER